MKKLAKRKKFDILKTFEIFNRESISILKNKLVEIVLIEADNIFSKNKNNKIFDLDFKKNHSLQISVYNDRQTYDLLSNTLKRQKLRQNELFERIRQNRTAINDKDNQSRVFN